MHELSKSGGIGAPSTVVAPRRATSDPLNDALHDGLQPRWQVADPLETASSGALTGATVPAIAGPAEAPEMDGMDAFRRTEVAAREEELSALRTRGVVHRSDEVEAPAETPNIGVSYRPDGLGTAHTGWDKEMLGNAGHGDLLHPQTVPSSLAGHAYPPRSEKPVMPAKVPGQSKRDRRAVVAAHELEVEAFKARLGGLNQDVADARVADDVSATMDGIDGLYLAGAPAAVHSQRGETLEDAALNVPTDPSGSTERDSRADHEHKMIAEARLRGMPVMGVCAGSWRLAEAYGGHAQTLPEEERSGHYVPGRDTWNTQHPVMTRPHTMVGGTFPVEQGLTIEELGDDDEVVGGQTQVSRSSQIDAVNSTHWATPAVDPRGHLLAAPGPSTPHLKEAQAKSRLPTSPDEELEVSAVAPNARGLPTVEAFESRHGAPVMGVQWHPEGYVPGGPGRESASPGAVEQSDELFKGFAQASGAYRGRQNVNAEFRRQYPHLGDDD